MTSSFAKMIFLLVQCCLLSSQTIAADKRPNIVIIMTDDMGFSDIGCYGGEIQTPYIDSLARQGLKCSQFYNCGKCEPTRAALITGRPPCISWVRARATYDHAQHELLQRIRLSRAFRRLRR